MSTTAYTPSSFAAEARQAASARVRLTRRGRLVFLGLPVVALLTALILGLTLAVSSADAATDKQPALVTVTVGSGESLWHVAQRTNPKADPRDVVKEIVSVNGLQSTQLSAGQQLEVPSFENGGR
ncbi:LysM peptidoglycan-binding domain-containing protein [Arthrobacter sp. UM1]|uniref:LysM peptidoglycan-binding domain-containing protein n=1 Tax=Arthrobacter sp. UM1 TaxID=2766776 RepID=UPI001CF60D84|nr:LysM peptidoglycan-binding domain-containing protein [Arthrobacter sp. UM1]MCB4208109.1 LysM peptidoglycan-binding domain-containing protein [Arthrobacter sp. UM1]